MTPPKSETGLLLSARHGSTGPTMAEILAGVPIDLTLIAERIRSNVKRTTESIIAVGDDLIAARDMLARGEFLPWIDAEFSWSRATAYNFIAAAELANKFPTVRNLQARTVYLLAAKATPESVVAEVASNLDAGAPVNHHDIALEVRQKRLEARQRLRDERRREAIKNKDKRAIREAAGEARQKREWAAWRAKCDVAVAEIVSLLSGKNLDVAAILAVEDDLKASGLIRAAFENMAASS